MDSDGIALLRVEGTAVDVPLLTGDVATVLLHVARRFAYEIDVLRPGDVHGHTDHRVVEAGFESNHLSAAPWSCPGPASSSGACAVFDNNLGTAKKMKLKLCPNLTDALCKEDAGTFSQYAGN
ncbi:hypothetical protein [Streptomyces afghaniensis]|uniref:hypothetical protein n=1 Tax=Streptomyces afghaniensis TaxID=66865 RepID=UPI0037A774A9